MKKILISFLMIFSMGLYSCIGPVPVEVVMMDDELFFVLEKEHEIESLRVIHFIFHQLVKTTSFSWCI